jgi:hypothetical protein
MAKRDRHARPREMCNCLSAGSSHSPAAVFVPAGLLAKDSLRVCDRLRPAGLPRIRAAASMTPSCGRLGHIDSGRIVAVGVSGSMLPALANPATRWYD